MDKKREARRIFVSRPNRRPLSRRRNLASSVYTHVQRAAVRSVLSQHVPPNFRGVLTDALWPNPIGPSLDIHFLHHNHHLPGPHTDHEHRSSHGRISRPSRQAIVRL